MTTNRHRARHTSLLLLVALTLGAVAAACGGGAAAGPEPAVPAGSASGAPSASAAPSASSAASAAPVASASAAPVFTGPMKSPVPTAMAADLQALGLDPKNLPPLGKLQPEKLRKVMKLIAKSLGAKCRDCHADEMSDPTPRKRVAENMWNLFVQRLSFADGSPVFCDSCHQGTISPLLDRRDKKALSRWMDANFVDRLARRDGKEHDCPTCHGEEQENHFIDLWKAGKPFIPTSD